MSWHGSWLIDLLNEDEMRNFISLRVRVLITPSLRMHVSDRPDLMTPASTSPLSLLGRSDGCVYTPRCAYYLYRLSKGHQLRATQLTQTIPSIAPYFKSTMSDQLQKVCRMEEYA
jgi:hypothetical protein